MTISRRAAGRAPLGADGRVAGRNADAMSAGALTRRSAIAILAGCGVFSTASALRVSEASPSQPRGARSLGQAAERSGLLFGASIASVGVDSPAYRDLYIAQARILTSDLALKFAALRPDSGAPHYADADLLVDFAQKHDMRFRGHNLIWNESNPHWIGTLDAAQLGALLDRHIDETVGRYAGRMHSWDVVNEPFWPDHWAPGFFRKGPWFDKLGPDYIGRALRRAGQADPAAKLVINEAFTERGDGLGLEVRRRMLRLIDDLQHAGVPLHAIGLEAHLQPQYPADILGFEVFLDEIARRKLDIYLTELDVDDVALPADVDERDRKVADYVFAFLTRALACPAVKVLECWQLSDRYSWYRDPALANRRITGGSPRPLPFDLDFRPKPMFDAILNALEARDQNRKAG